MRILRKVALFIVLAATLQTETYAQEAPLGLSWGIPAADVRGRGIDLKEFPGSEFGKSFGALKVDRAVADQELAILGFGFNDKLWRIVISSRKFSNDPAGSAVLDRYNELSSVLSEKYGRPKEFHRLGRSIYSESRYFVAGIRGGESQWYSDFDTATLMIQLGVMASDSSTSRWRIIYENKALQKEFERARRSKEKGSL